MNSRQKIGNANIQRIQFDKFEKDFSFIVNGKEYKTNSFVASILSPTISKEFEENMNKSYYEINIEQEGDFNRIIEYGEMKEVDIKPEENQYFKNVMKQLGNNFEFLRFSKEFQEEISYENVMNRIQIKNELNVNLDEEISFISNNFHSYYTEYPESILTLDIHIIEKIISNTQLKLYDEKELFDVILQLYLKSNEYSILFSYIIFINLPKESIREFNEHFDINDMNQCIWENITHRLEQDISTKSKEAYHNEHQEFLKNRYEQDIHKNTKKQQTSSSSSSLYVIPAKKRNIRKPKVRNISSDSSESESSSD